MAARTMYCTLYNLYGLIVLKSQTTLLCSLVRSEAHVVADWKKRGSRRSSCLSRVLKMENVTDETIAALVYPFLKNKDPQLAESFKTKANVVSVSSPNCQEDETQAYTFNDC